MRLPRGGTLWISILTGRVDCLGGQFTRIFQLSMEGFSVGLTTEEVVLDSFVVRSRQEPLFHLLGVTTQKAQYVRNPRHQIVLEFSLGGLVERSFGFVETIQIYVSTRQIHIVQSFIGRKPKRFLISLPSVLIAPQIPIIEGEVLIRSLVPWIGLLPQLVNLSLLF